MVFQFPQSITAFLIANFGPAHYAMLKENAFSKGKIIDLIQTWLELISKSSLAMILFWGRLGETTGTESHMRALAKEQLVSTTGFLVVPNSELAGLIKYRR